MSLIIDTDSIDYRFNKTLNEDAQLTSNIYGEWDILMIDGDYVNVTGVESLANACVIAILTRYNELYHNQLYEKFGCRVHELIKENSTNMNRYKMEVFITETLTMMRRIKTVNSVNITESEPNKYLIQFDITSINDETITGGLTI